MGTQPNPAPKVVFGPFEYDDLSGDLRKYGTVLRLQGKPLQILSFLVNRPGQIISRDDLQRHLWEGTTFVDFEQGLNSAVNKLRQTLGDSADQPRYVETLPGRGLQIHRSRSASFRECYSGDRRPVAVRIEPKPRRQPRWWLLFVAGMALSVVASGGYWLAKRSTVPVEAPNAIEIRRPAACRFCIGRRCQPAVFRSVP